MIEDSLLLLYLWRKRYRARRFRFKLLLWRYRLQLRTRNDIRVRALAPSNHCLWAYISKYGTDEDFLDVFSLSKYGFNTLHKSFRKYYGSSVIGIAGGRPSKFTSLKALGLLLHFYATKCVRPELAMLYGCSKTTVSRILAKAEYALSFALTEEKLAHIKWPSKTVQVEWGRLVTAKFDHIHGRFGFVDGKNFTVQEPSNVDVQNAMYNGWLHSTFITGTLCFGVDGTIIWGKHNCYGSWNDGDISRELQEMLLNDDLVAEGHGLVADTAFPVCGDLKGKIYTPLKEGDVERADPRYRAVLLERSKAITSLRQACEWGVGSIEKAWHRILEPLPYDKYLRGLRLGNIFRLWNFRVRTTGISQIRSYFFDLGAGI